MDRPSDQLLRIAPPLESELKIYLERHRAELTKRLSEGEDGIQLGRRHARMLDGLMMAMFAAARGAMRPGMKCALAATGSYGRGALALRSDADVRLIVEGSSDRDAATAFTESLLYPLWDAGLSVGHQVSDIAETLDLAQRDLPTATALIDMRLLAGDAALFESLVTRANEGLFAEAGIASFIERLDAEAEGRHARYGDSVFLLEPDVKHGPGALRDLDGARWVARARYRVGDQDTASAWSELVRLGVLVTREAQELERAERLLWRVRNRLHAHAGRRSDRLTFDAQETIARELGYAGGAAESAEQLMQDYYVAARAIARGRERIFVRVLPPKRRTKPVETDLGQGVRMFDGQVTIASVELLEAEPVIALRAYAQCVRLEAPILPFAREAIARVATDANWCERLRASTEAASLFVELVCTVPEVPLRHGSAAFELHDVGLLLAMVPEFSPVTGKVHHDVYHVYTVDVHSVAAVDCLRALCRGERGQESPLASRLAAEVVRPRPLFLATLLHDVGKGYPDADGSRKNHSKTGAELCEKILPRLGCAAGEILEARTLIEQHLAMYHVATRRDLDDPATVSDFSELVRGREGLRDLYLLTVADLTTTSPTAMTSWKARMLDELYFAADAYLSGRDSSYEVQRLEYIQNAARAGWERDPAFLEAFTRSMPERYLLSQEPEAIRAHAGVAMDRDGREILAALIPGGDPDVAQLCVVAADMPGLLARIAAAITASRLEVHAAQVYTRQTTAGIEAVDLFWVRDRIDGASGVERTLPRLQDDLLSLCRGRVIAGDLVRDRLGSSSPWRQRPSPAVHTEIVIDNRASPKHTVVEVFAKDRPGLLFTVAAALHELGLSISLSKINTEGTKVADVFYVSELDGAKVTDPARVQQVRQLLLSVVAPERDGVERA